MNLPAHLVVVKSTQAWRGAGMGYREYPKSTLLQMMVRAASAARARARDTSARQRVWP